MKLTARQALVIGQELWGWLEDNPGRDKDEWPGWEKYGEMESECPLCEYVKNIIGPSRCSKHCLIYWRSKPDLRNHCTNYDTPYDEWCRASTPRSERFWAGKVAKLHREALERLEG